MEKEKKVGILSMHRVVNYGSFWQAYSLKKIIEELNYESDFIDLKNGKQVTEEKYVRKFSLSKIKRIPYYIFSKKRIKLFNEAHSEFLNLKVPNYDENYKAIIIGSDEMFNCAQAAPWGFSKQMFGDMNNDRVFSYAASYGRTTLEFIKSKKIDKEMADSLLKMKSISVRDKNSFDIVKNLTEIESEINLDPVLVYKGLENEYKEINENKKYILIYGYDFRIKDEEYVNDIKKYAKKNNLQIISVGTYQSWCKNVLVDPQELLGYFKNAEYVVTDTFHGTIFSIRFNRKFSTIVRKSNKQKLRDLLTRLGLEKRIVNDELNLEKEIKNEIDYKKVREILEEEEKNTKEYILKNIEG
ncbi:MULTISPECIES: polysaccharide pyruvyl transferase family protein [Helcococcus]|uniref:Polysaccharide pyruvyl transferase family protein n=1 Tax=Helcococcus bovis TaxID=3153252 RepID=A0ABW9F416_9FIRM